MHLQHASDDVVQPSHDADQELLVSRMTPSIRCERTQVSVAVQEKELRNKGLAQMYQHVKTYMDLEMWELARQKAITIMKNFPESPEANELAKLYEHHVKAFAKALTLLDAGTTEADEAQQKRRARLRRKLDRAT